MQNVFKTKIEAAKALGYKIISNLEEANDSYGYSTILLAGGGTPGPLYKYLNLNYSDFDKTTVGLVDERFVEHDSEFSNDPSLKCGHAYLEAQMLER